MSPGWKRALSRVVTLPAEAETSVEVEPEQELEATEYENTEELVAEAEVQTEDEVAESGETDTDLEAAAETEESADIYSVNGLAEAIGWEAGELYDRLEIRLDETGESLKLGQVKDALQASRKEVEEARAIKAQAESQNHYRRNECRDNQKIDGSHSNSPSLQIVINFEHPP